MVLHPVSKEFYLAVCAVEYGLVSEWVTQANPIFFINEILNFETAVIFQICHLNIE